jgi:hypothetical protein
MESGTGLWRQRILGNNNRTLATHFRVFVRAESVSIHRPSSDSTRGIRAIAHRRPHMDASTSTRGHIRGAVSGFYQDNTDIDA